MQAVLAQSHILAAPSLARRTAKILPEENNSCLPLPSELQPQ